MKKRTYKQSDIKVTKPYGYFRKKPCKYCKETFQPLAVSHLFCSDHCKDRSYTNSYYYKNYGLSIEEVENLLESQNHLCAICNEEGFKMHEGVWTKLCIDHNHDTGEVRGALCHNCNRAIGLLKDDVNRLKSAITYLEGATTIPEGSTSEVRRKRTTS